MIDFNGFSAGINLPPALRGESLHGLPPYAPTEHYPVAGYPGVPAGWNRGDALTATYFVGVAEGSGMWIDLTRNQHLGDHVAVIPVIQGVNAITALPAAERPLLEQYRTNCPVHGTPFAGNRHCASCGFDWPGQNYLSSATGATLWIDGFRTKGGNGQPTAETRQFVFTQDQARGIASQVIGEARSFDVKLHFFRGPQKPPRPVYRSKGFGLESMGVGPVLSLAETTRGGSAPEVAAGARIRQDVGLDPLLVHQYGELAATIQIYYVYKEEMQRILSSGRVGEGSLSGLVVGNPGSGSPHKVF